MTIAGMLGLGWMEILILLLFCGGPIVAGIVLYVVLSRRPRGPSAGDYNALLDENERLRAENDRLRRGQ